MQYASVHQSYFSISLASLIAVIAFKILGSKKTPNVIKSDGGILKNKNFPKPEVKTRPKSVAF